MQEQNFARTLEALEELKTALQSLNHAVEVKKNALLQQRHSYKNNLNNLNKTVQETVSVIRSVYQKIDQVVQEDGTNHNNN